MSANPYNWQSHTPKVQIPRSGVAKAAKILRNNGSAVVMGGRGMGKSVFLQQLKVELEGDEGTCVVLVDAPPPALTVEACLDDLAQALGVPAGRHRSRFLFDELFSRDDAPERLVLLFDEFDRYAEKGPASAQPPGRGFFNDLEASRRGLPRLSILAAGSIGIFVVRDVLGSSFLARALYLPLRPFQRTDFDVLVRAFGERSPPSEEALDALFLASGGIPALTTFGLQELWDFEGDANADDVTTIFTAFKKDYRAYLRDLLDTLTEPRFSDAPRRVWELIQAEPGRVERSRLQAALEPASGALNLTIEDTLYLLEVGGVVRVESSSNDPIDVRPIASLLQLSRAPERPSELREQFLKDLLWLLGRLHRSSLDFFRPRKPGAPAKERPALVPESVFTAHLALGFELLGWRTEREAQRAAGRTDLIVRRNGDTEALVVELKIWGRNDYREAHRQVESYWTDDVAAGAVVQLTDADLPDWPERYQRECLTAPTVAVELRDVPADSPVRAWFRGVSSTPDGVEVTIDHFLLRLPRR